MEQGKTRPVQDTYDHDEHTPERLFTRFDPRPSDHFLAYIALKPLRSLVAFVAGSFIFVWLITLGQAKAGTEMWLDVTPHVAVIPLVVGLVILPRRLFWIPVAIYPVAVTLNILLREVLTPGYLTATDIKPVAIAATAYFLAMLAAAEIGRGVHFILRRQENAYRADVAHVVATSVSVTVLGALVTVWLLQASPLGTILSGKVAGGDLTLEDLALIRFVKLGASAGIFFLVFLERSSPKRMILVALGALLGLLMGVLDHTGLGLHLGLDIYVPLIAFALIFRVNHSASLAAMAVLVYELLTQHLARVPDVPSHSDHVIEVYRALALVLLFGVCLRRLVTAEETNQNKRAIARLEQVQKFVSVGYFVFDYSNRTPSNLIISVDAIAAEILRTGPMFRLEEILRRVAPNDLPGVTDALTDETTALRRFDFHLALDDVWNAASETRFISSFIWYETRPTGQRVAYGAVLDLTVEDRREQELRSALARLSDQQNKQTQLFSIVSHELRTPASIIRMLIDEMSETGDWASLEPKIRNVTDQLLNVLADIRQVVRPEQNLPVHLEPLTPLETLEQLRNNFAGLAQSHAFSIQIEAGTNSGEVRMTDRTRLNQALSNLIRNAIIHSGGKNIFLAYREERGGADPVGIWTVADDGYGIPTDMQDGLFQPFSRLQRSDAGHVDGSGLGLYVVKTSMEMLGGTVTVTDRAGGGVRFDIRLPMPLMLNPLPAASDLAERRAAWADRSVLVVEDNELMAEMLVKRLGLVFGRVSLARNGREAIEAHMRGSHDVVLTDLFMPEMSGDQLTSTLRAMGFKGTIIGMTAASIGEDFVGFENAGTDAVLVKPVRMDELIELLSRIATVRSSA